MLLVITTYHIFGVLLLLALIPSLYLRFVVCKERSRAWQLACWIPIVLMLVILLLMFPLLNSAFVMRTFSTYIACLLFPLLAFTAVSAIGWVLALKWKKVFRIANIVAAVISGIMALAALYGAFIGWRTLEVKQVDLYFDNLPEAFEGYRIVQLSDMHVGTYGSDVSFVEEVIARANIQKPDLVVFTGDLVNTDAAELEPFELTLAQLYAPGGVYAVLGNHDYCRYGFNKSEEAQQQGVEQVKHSIHKAGWHLLTDEHVWIRRDSDSIAIMGVGNISRPPFPHAGDLEKAMTGLPDSAFAVLLSHDPTHWRMEVLGKTSIPLTLSGHTHAAQLKLFGLSPASMTYTEWSGVYQEGKQQLCVSEGTGGTFAFRLGTKPQIVVITLHRK